MFRTILHQVQSSKPDYVVTYKGYSLDADSLQTLRAAGCTLVNIYPDCSPHSSGARHKKAVGVYDLVISTKPFHPALWSSLYGYKNRCLFVPQGYDPSLHLSTEPPPPAVFDITMAATWRPEYGTLMKTVAQLTRGHSISFAIAGNGWENHRSDYPASWTFSEAVAGRAYLEWLRRGRICIAPVTREVSWSGTVQPGDEDSTRTYELAAARCFFLHRRTDYVRTIFDSSEEVPLYDNATELAEQIFYYLPREAKRQKMRDAAHARAVPAYSLDSRAAEIVAILKELKEEAGRSARPS